MPLRLPSRINVLRHILQLCLCPSRYGMDVANFIAHEIQIAYEKRNWLGAET